MPHYSKTPSSTTKQVFCFHEVAIWNAVWEWLHLQLNANNAVITSQILNININWLQWYKPYLLSTPHWVLSHMITVAILRKLSPPLWHVNQSFSRRFGERCARGNLSKFYPLSEEIAWKKKQNKKQRETEKNACRLNLTTNSTHCVFKCTDSLHEPKSVLVPDGPFCCILEGYAEHKTEELARAQTGAHDVWHSGLMVTI